MKAYKCDDCHDTGWVGDNGPGRNGNSEYHECGCGSDQKYKRYPFEKVIDFLKSFAGKYTDKDPNWYIQRRYKQLTELSSDLLDEINAAELPNRKRVIHARK